MHSLYICYFGVREPLVQTQVLPYLRQLVKGGVKISLLTFEPAPDSGGGEFKQIKDQLSGEGIDWFHFRYHKRPSLPATLFDITAGGLLAARLIRTHGVELLHARSHVAAAMALIAKRLTGVPFIFDIRGFLPEEYTDAGIWPANGHLYRIAKSAEKRLMNAADAFVVLTEKARGILFAQTERPVEVIPCCVDFNRFQIADSTSRETMRKELGVSDRRVFVYLGALDGWYLTDELADFLALVTREDPKAFLLILTQSAASLIEKRLADRGVEANDYLVKRISPDEVPRYLKACDVAVSFIKPCYSKLASSPTKIAEYLISGLPVVSNAGIGDLDELIERDKVGVLVRGFSTEEYSRALKSINELRIDLALADRCRASAKTSFDLETVGGARYRRLYERLNGQRTT